MTRTKQKSEKVISTTKVSKKGDILKKSRGRKQKAGTSEENKYPEGATSPPPEGPVPSIEGKTLPLTEGSIPPVEGKTSPPEGLVPSVEGKTSPPPEGLVPSVEGKTSPPEGPVPPVEGETATPLPEGEIPPPPAPEGEKAPPTPEEIAPPTPEGEKAPPTPEGEKAPPTPEGEIPPPPTPEGEKAPPTPEGEIPPPPPPEEIPSPPPAEKAGFSIAPLVYGKLSGTVPMEGQALPEPDKTKKKYSLEGLVDAFNNPTINRPAPPSMENVSFPEQGGSTVMQSMGLASLFDKDSVPISNLVIVFIAATCMVLSMVISIYYVILLLIKIIIEEGIIKMRSPLNSDTTDFISIQSLSFTGGPFNYLYFLILPGISFGCIVLLLILRGITTTAPLSSEMKQFLTLLGVLICIVLFSQFAVYTNAKKRIRAVERRLTYFNKYVCTKIYKNVKFLENISEPLGSIIAVNAAIKQSLLQLDNTMETVNIAQAFYTLSMFNHYQKIGLRNPKIYDAFDIFKPASLLGSKCNPGSFLTRYGTYVEDISESVLRFNLPPSLKEDPLKVDEAFQLCSEWITNTNSYANTIYPEDAFNAFMVMVVLTFIIQTIVPLYAVNAMYSSQDDTKLSFVGRLIKKIVNLLK